MKTNKKVVILATFATIGAMLSSCAGSSSEIEILEPELMTIDELKSEYNENNKIEVTFWHGFGKTMEGALDQAIGLFEKQYPYIKVVKPESKGGYDGLHGAVMNSLQSSTWPNVVVGYPDHFADYISSNIQYTLDKFIESEEYGVDLDDYYEQYMRENRSLLYHDKEQTKPYTVGLPFNKSTEVMVYNKDFFEAFDLTPPTTWDEAIAVGKECTEIIKGTSSKLTKDEDKVSHFKTTWQYTKGEGDSAKTYTFDFIDCEEKDFRPLSYDSQSNFFITMCYQFGGKYTEMDDIKHGYMSFKGDEKVKEAMNFVKSMHDEKVLGIPGDWNETDYCSNPFKSLKSVMTISSSAGVANNIPAGGKFNVGISPIPYKTADKKFVISQGTNLAILDCDKKHALASWLLIRFLSGGEVIEASTTTKEVNANVTFAISSGYLPVTKSGEDSKRYKDYVNSESILPSDIAKVAVQKIANQEYVGKNWQRFVDSAFVGSSDIREEAGKIIPLMLVGASGKKYTIDEAIDYVYGRLSGYVRK